MINLNPNQNLNSYIHRFIKTFFVNEFHRVFNRLNISIYFRINFSRKNERKKEKKNSIESNRRFNYHFETIRRNRKKSEKGRDTKLRSNEEKKHDLCSVLNISNDQLYHKIIAGNGVQPPVARIPSFHLVGRPQSKI